jgi:glycerol kinase
MSYILAFDQGTTNSRSLVFDAAGKTLSSAQREFRQIYPRAGWVEHDPLEIWKTQLETAQQALRTAGLTGADIAAIGITNQRETTIVWDRSTGQPLHNAIVWQDRRTSDLCDAMKSRQGPDATRITGLSWDPYFSGTKLHWLLESVPSLRRKAEQGQVAFGTVDSWLIWNLTRGKSHRTDYTNASRTLLFDINQLAWSQPMLEHLGIPPSLLPEVLPSTADFGESAADYFGKPIRITGVAGDQQAALVGQAGFQKGVAKNTYGTGSFLLLNTGVTPPPAGQGLISTVAFALEPKRASYALEAAVFVTGAAVQWLRDGLGIITKAAEIEQLAQQVADTGGVYFVPAFVGLGTPHWDPRARGAIVGITRGTTRAHIARATLEAIAFQTCEALEVMQHHSGTTLSELRVDGGASANNFLMQLQADFLGVDVVRPRNIETTALGAAFLAGLKVGYWPNPEAVQALWAPDRRFTPSITEGKRRNALRLWKRAVERSKAWEEDASSTRATT